MELNLKHIVQYKKIKKKNKNKNMLKLYKIRGATDFFYETKLIQAKECLNNYNKMFEDVDTNDKISEFLIHDYEFKNIFSI